MWLKLFLSVEGTREFQCLKPSMLGKVLMVCWGGHDNVGAYFFKDVPPREVEELEENVGDWRNLLEKYGTPEEIREAESYGVYIKGFRLPKIVKV